MSDKKDKSKQSKVEKGEEVKEKNRDKGQKIKCGESAPKAEVKAKCKDKTQKRKHDETGEEDNIHSANDWEHADLGDDDRKNKFLRLMGATKKDHKGKILIGEKNATHGRSKEDTQKVSEDLEEQYKQGLEMKLSGQARRHVGLGFHGNNADQIDNATCEKDDKSSSSDSGSDVPSKSKAGGTKFGLFVKASK